MQAILATHRGGKYFIFLMFLTIASFGVLRSYLVHEPFRTVIAMPKKARPMVKKIVVAQPHPIAMAPSMTAAEEAKPAPKKIPAPLPKAINLNLPLKSGAVR